MPEADRRQFVDHVVKVVKQRFPLVKIEPVAEAFAVKVNGHIAGLENVYRMSANGEDANNKRQIERWMVELLRASEGSPDEGADFEQLKERIYPMILSQHNVDERHSVVTEPLIGDLVIAYAIDNDRTITYILRRHFEQWKIDLEMLHDTAIENLITRSEAINAQAAQDDEGEVSLIIFRTGDGYDASRLLLPTLHERLREYLGSPFGAAIPNRDILLCFRNDEPILSRVRKQVREDYDHKPHQVTPGLLLVTADGIAVQD
ncbi:MAG TPA: DUF1444 family protein [Tepidisphaeraceae bacterium]|jgi:hypothetical protein